MNCSFPAFARLCAIFATTLFLSSLGSAQEPAQAPQQATSPITAFQRATLEIERKKVELEVWKTCTTAAAIIIPILVGFWSIRTQARAQFELKAAELVLASPSKSSAKRRAELLQKMFKRWLPGNFAASFEAENFPSLRFHEMKLELFRAITSGDCDKSEVLEVYGQIFPEEEWFKKTFPS